MANVTYPVTQDGDAVVKQYSSITINAGDTVTVDKEFSDFVKNRLVCFDAQRMHKGNAPNTYMPRITLVFKTAVKYNE